MTDTTKLFMFGFGILAVGTVMYLALRPPEVVAPAQPEFVPNGGNPVPTDGTAQTAREVVTGLTQAFGTVADWVARDRDRAAATAREAAAAAERAEQRTYCRAHPEATSCGPQSANSSSGRAASAN